jgi:hypothetical protein
MVRVHRPTKGNPAAPVTLIAVEPEQQKNNGGVIIKKVISAAVCYGRGRNIASFKNAERNAITKIITTCRNVWTRKYTADSLVALCIASRYLDIRAYATI